MFLEAHKLLGASEGVTKCMEEKSRIELDMYIIYKKNFMGYNFMLLGTYMLSFYIIDESVEFFTYKVF